MAPEQFEAEVQNTMCIICDCVPYNTPNYHEEVRRRAENIARDLTLYRKCTRKKKRTRYDYEAEHEYNNETNENDYTL